ncbi:hypothetical protein ABPG74_022111 [Tetrahymena malaccensis]
MSCFIYSKLSFEAKYQRVQIDDNLFFENKISVEDLEDYLQQNLYMTPVQIIKQSVSEEQFIYNYSSIVLQLKERIVEKILNFIFENNSYELTLKLQKNKSTIKVKFLLNLIRKQLKIDSQIYISTQNQNQFKLEDSVSVLETIYVSLQPFKSSPKKLINQKDSCSIPFDQISEASTSDQSLSEAKERSSEIFFDLLFNPSEFNSTQTNNLSNINNNNQIYVENYIPINQSVNNTQSTQLSSSEYFKMMFNPSQFNSTQNNYQQSINNNTEQMQFCVQNNIYNSIPLIHNKYNQFPIPPKPQNQQNGSINPFLKKSNFINSFLQKKSFLQNRLNFDNEEKKLVCIPIKKSIRKQF